MRCLVCHSEDTRKFLFLERDPKVRSSWGVPSYSQTIYQCRHCSLQFTDRVIGSEEEAAMYGQSYHELMAGELGSSEASSGAREQSLQRLQLIKKYQPGGDLLDAGCSTGIFLSAAHRAGFNVWGLDPSEYACNVTRSRPGIPSARIFQSNIADAPILKEKKFDVITAWDVIEHCADPEGDLQKMTAALKPGGIVVLRTPNSASIFFQTAIWLYRVSLKKIKFPLLSIYHSDHLVFFDRKSLHYILQKMGLSPLCLAPEPLLWKRFKYCECRRGPVVNLGISSLYFAGRAFGSGHGLIGIARKADNKTN